MPGSFRLLSLHHTSRKLSGQQKSNPFQTIYLRGLARLSASMSQALVVHRSIITHFTIHGLFFSAQR